MRTINVCLIILIVSIGLTNSIDFASLNEIQSLKQNTFASSLIETISLSLSSAKGEDATEVLSMLNNLKNQLQTDQENDDQTFRAKDTEFQEHIDKLTAEIAKLDGEIKALAARIIELEGLINQANLNIQSFNDRINSLTETLIDLENKFKSDKKYYEEKIAGLKVLVSKLEDVISKLKQMIGSVSGVGKYEHIGATDSEKRDIAWKAEQRASFLQIRKLVPDQYSNMVELSMNADQGALEKLLGILSGFSKEASAEIVSKETYLQNLEDTYADLVKQMNDEIELNKEAKKTQEEKRAEYENEKALKSTEKTEKENRKAALEKEKEINLGLQTQLKSTHDKEKLDRSKEEEIVDTLVKIVQKRLVK